MSNNIQKYDIHYNKMYSTCLIIYKKYDIHYNKMYSTCLIIYKKYDIHYNKMYSMSNNIQKIIFIVIKCILHV